MASVTSGADLRTAASRLRSRSTLDPTLILIPESLLDGERRSLHQRVVGQAEPADVGVVGADPVTHRAAEQLPQRLLRGLWPSVSHSAMSIAAWASVVMPAPADPLQRRMAWRA